MKKTIIATALLTLFAGSAAAQDWTWDTVESHEDWTYSGDGQPYAGGVLHQNEALQAGKTLKLTATEHEGPNYTANGLHSTSENVTNNGLIYVLGGESNYSMVGMTAGNENGLTATNAGHIFVDSQNGAQVAAIGTTPNGKVVNSGTIQVKGNNSYGVISWAGTSKKPISIENTGTIVAQGEGATAIRVGEVMGVGEDGDFGEVNTIVNEGNVLATDGAQAIVALAKDTQLKLQGQSNVVGVVEMGAETDLIVALENENNNSTQLELKADKLRKVELQDSTLEFTGAQSKYEFDSLSSEGDSQIRLIGNERTLKVNALDGSVSLYSDHVSAGSTPVFAVDGIGADDQLNVTFGGNTADNIGDTSDLINVFNSSVAATDGTGNNAAYTGVIAETVTTGEMTYTRDENGNVTTSMKTATVAESTKEMAALNAMSWRSELSTLTDRMGSIRTQPKNVGSWIRYTGEELEKDDVTATLKMNTVELGVDMPIGQTAWTVGASFSYGDGDGDFDAGSTDNKKYTLGLYATYINEYGCFLDIIGKVGKVQSDFEFATTSGVVDTGDVDQTGYIFGVEAGKRFTGQTFFAEPSVGLIYSRLDSDSTKTQNRAVKLDAVDSLIARAGTLFGGQFADGRANLYGKAFILHDFQGDVEGQAKALSQGAKWRSFEQELAGTWGEFGVGGTYDFTESSKFYFDISKTVGGDVDSNYRVNVGAKYTF